MKSSQTATGVQHYHVHYVRTTVDRLWQALTDPSDTQRYYHGLSVDSDFRPGSPIRYLRPDEQGGTVVVLSGEVLEAEPGRRLVHTFQFADLSDAPSRVTYEMTQLGDVVKLTVTHDDFAGESDTYLRTTDGWPPILSALKTLIETGSGLHIPPPGHD